MLAALTGAGLSAAAGLNAYIPFLIVALVSRYTDVITLPASFTWIESPWAIGIASLLLLSEIVLDKIPAIDSLNDAVGTAIRPATGGIIFAATAAAQQYENNSSFFTNNPWVGVVLGGLTAAIVHTGKMVSRPIINVGTLGIGAPVVSTVEDGTSFTVSLIAIFLPALVILVLGLLAFVLWKIFRFAQRRKKRPSASQKPNEYIIDGDSVILEGEIED
ncbi:DUF4126 domain-containing protein [Arcanobacterium ihumii]|uniref:DUF4126 domain-containing protein n=1 Tax=Arcanobacterium ihumii TaxID=2138162 RepID=UPI000F5363EB|nr:DUF4126 domain-containing protein [Arcanobacterium ihumii]